ncbi:hypothetical protein TorRG33x02_073220 [Trema orientale]|uniref:Uncharacterized protein n=1 Tax=Trema orientale TaxID=63057 RepID=A0A2P5FGN2_TREOI|nr:hypothetical protein TorRG33x02_073220 [Trema orientale]
MNTAVDRALLWWSLTWLDDEKLVKALESKGIGSYECYRRLGVARMSMSENMNNNTSPLP